MILKRFKRTALWLLCISTAVAGTADQRDLRVKKGDFIQTAVLTGSLQAQKYERFVVPQSNSWQIQIKWMVKEGDYVKAGDPVVRFDTSSLASDIETLEMSLQEKLEQKAQKRAENQHKKFELEVQLKKAETDYKKIELDASVPKGIVSNYDYDKKQLDLKRSEQALENARLEKQVQLAAMTADIRRLEIEIEEARVKLKKNKDMLEGLVLKAKSAGTVVYARHRWQDRKIQVGDNVMTTWTVASIPDNNSLQVEAWVNETGINQVKQGQKVDVFLDAYPGRMFTGRVNDVLNSAEKRKQWGKAHYFRVLIVLDNRDLDIMKPGMSVKCIVHVAKHPQALLIPIEMVHVDNRDYWVKPRGEEAVKIQPLGLNEFYLALAGDETLEEGTALAPVISSDIKEEEQ
jgi:multidrug efflux pump subunit AcrA (membrane-fusion protein)